VGDVPAPRFVFRGSSAKPRHRVTCCHCGWTTSGNDPDVFGRADVHTCDSGPRAGLAPTTPTEET
jgi:hypothetical protein